MLTCTEFSSSTFGSACQLLTLPASSLSCLKERVRAFIEDTSDKDVLVLNVQDPFQRLLLHGVCEVNMFPTRPVSSGRIYFLTLMENLLVVLITACLHAVL
jgi:hypothetical protein